MKKPSHATLLVDLAKDYQYFVSPDGQPFVTFLVDTATSIRTETWPLSSRRFRQHLCRRFYNIEGAAAGGDAIRSALGVLEGRAFAEGDTLPIHQRIGYDPERGIVYLDLANAEWEAVAITSQGWKVIPSDRVTVKFRRGAAMLPLPRPGTNGSFEPLKTLLGIAEDSFRLLVGFLVGALRPTGPYPVLELHGEQDSGKSQATRMMRELIDPHKLKLRAQPREARDLAVAVENVHLVAFDNLSGIPVWFSDALCRLSTGGGISFRQLYTDDEERIFEGQRPVVMNGINELAVRGDLLDRAIFVKLTPIGADKRKSERDLFRQFEQHRPRILGALLDAVSAALQNEATAHIENPPRLADFAIWVQAAEPKLPWKPGAFLESYRANRREANRHVVDASPLASLLMEWLMPEETWEGTATDLLQALETFYKNVKGKGDRKAGDAALRGLRRDSGWPKDGTRMGQMLRRLAPNLRRAGLEVQERPRTSDSRGWTLKRAPERKGNERHQRHQRHGEGPNGAGEGSHDASDANDAAFSTPQAGLDALEAEEGME